MRGELLKHWCALCLNRTIATKPLRALPDQSLERRTAVMAARRTYRAWGAIELKRYCYSEQGAVLETKEQRAPWSRTPRSSVPRSKDGAEDGAKAT